MSNKNLLIFAAFFAWIILLSASCARTGALVPVNREKGLASWYGPGFHGRRTASGEKYDQHKLTAAHRSLPFNTMVKVYNLENHRSVIVRINDRGPFVGKRIIDLSKEAAKRLDIVRTGTASVVLFYLPKDEGRGENI